jgi:hypothetical protein
VDSGVWEDSEGQNRVSGVRTNGKAFDLMINGVTLLVASVSIIILGGLFFFATRFGKYLYGDSHGRRPVFGVVVPLVAAAAGATVGALFLPSISEPNVHMRLVYCLAVFLVIGIPEILLVRRLPDRFREVYLLDGIRFPFFAIGLSGAMFVSG